MKMLAFLFYYKNKHTYKGAAVWFSIVTLLNNGFKSPSSCAKPMCDNETVNSNKMANNVLRLFLIIQIELFNDIQI